MPHPPCPGVAMGSAGRDWKANVRRAEVRSRRGGVRSLRISALRLCNTRGPSGGGYPGDRPGAGRKHEFARAIVHLDHLPKALRHGTTDLTIQVASKGAKPRRAAEEG